MQLLYGHDQVVGEWAGRQFGVEFVPPFSAIGVITDEGRLIGASIFNDCHSGGNIEWTHVGPRTMTRKVCRAVVHYAFVVNNATRLTAKTRRSNKVVPKLLMKAGFGFECVMKRYFGPEKGDDALVYVLFPERAGRWMETKQ